jgi:hypothetical protein
MHAGKKSEKNPPALSAILTRAFMQKMAMSTYKTQHKFLG